MVISGQALIVVIVIAISIWLGDEAWSGIKKVNHNIKCKFHHSEDCKVKE